jgi:hypothetical protein
MRRQGILSFASAALLAPALVLLGAPGCSKKLPNEPIGTTLVAYPEGVRDSAERTPSDLVVWPDVPITVFEGFSLADGAPTVFTAYRTQPGSMQGLIADYLQAGAYQLFRQEEGGGFRSFSDFNVSPAKRWADRTYFGSPSGTQVLPPGQLFPFSDRAPSPIALKGYVGRAVVSGLSSAGSALTNLGAAPDTIAIRPIAYTGLTGIPGNTNTGPAPPDSLLDLSWEAIPGAASYWVHIYQKRGDIRISEEAFNIAQASPIAQGKVRDLFIGRFPATTTAYKLGNPPPAGSRILVYRVLIGLQEVLIRVSAVNAQGRLIATTGLPANWPTTLGALGGDLDSFAVRVGQFDKKRYFPLGAVRVTPGRPIPPP